MTVILLLTEVFEQVRKSAIGAVLEQEVQIIFILEGAVELYDTAVVRKIAANITLSENGLNLVILSDMRLF